MPQLSLADIETLCYDALTQAGASEEQARIVAGEIADAEAEGIRNVGLGYMHLYLKHLHCGKVKAHAQPTIVKTSAAATVIDAASGAKRAKVTVPLLSGNRVTLCLARAVPTDLMFSRNSLKTIGAVTTGSSRAPPQPPLGRPLDADSSVSPPHAVSVAMPKSSSGQRVRCCRLRFIARL
jgi:hypothetical protein